MNFTVRRGFVNAFFLENLTNFPPEVRGISFNDRQTEVCRTLEVK